jgi:hypothetical protein
MSEYYSSFFPGGSANVTLTGPGMAAGLPTRVWHLSDWSAASANREGAVLASGWADFEEPDIVHRWFESAQVDGATWLGAVGQKTEFSLPVHLNRTPTTSFERIRDRFFDDLTPWHTSRLTVNSPRGVRFKDVRLGGKPEVQQTDIAAEVRQRQSYLVPVVAGQAFWQGLQVRRVWADGRWDRTAGIANHGDVPAHIDWVLRGPALFKVPDGDSLVVINVEDGETVRLTTDRSARHVVSDKRPDIHRVMGGQRLRFPLAPRESRSVQDIVVVNAGADASAVVSIRPQFRRPF